MARLHCDMRKWGAVKDPKTGDRIQLNEEHNAEIAMRVADAYEPISAELDESESSEGSEANYSEWPKDKLKAEIRERGIEDDVDLRSTEQMVEILS